MGTLYVLFKYWHEMGTKFDDGGTKIDKLDTKYNPEVIKCIPL